MFWCQVLIYWDFYNCQVSEHRSFWNHPYVRVFRNNHNVLVLNSIRPSQILSRGFRQLLEMGGTWKLLHIFWLCPRINSIGWKSRIAQKIADFPNTGISCPFSCLIFNKFWLRHVGNQYSVTLLIPPKPVSLCIRGILILPLPCGLRCHERSGVCSSGQKGIY